MFLYFCFKLSTFSCFVDAVTNVKQFTVNCSLVFLMLAYHTSKLLMCILFVFRYLSASRFVVLEKGTKKEEKQNFCNSLKTQAS